MFTAIFNVFCFGAKLGHFWQLPDWHADFSFFRSKYKWFEYGIILRFLVSVLIISGLLLILPGIKTTRSYCAIITAVPITIINMLIMPLFEIYAVPLTALVFGLIIVVLDSLLLWFFGLILKRISVDGFGWAFVFAVVLSLIIYMFELVFEPGYFNIMEV